jgi:hypothetical protein
MSKQDNVQGYMVDPKSLYPETTEVAKAIPTREGLITTLGDGVYRYHHPYLYRSGGDSHRVALRLKTLIPEITVVKHGEVFTHAIPERYHDCRDRPHWFVTFRLPQGWKYSHLVDMKPYGGYDYDETPVDEVQHAVDGGFDAGETPDLRMENNDGVELEYTENLADAAAQQQAMDTLAVDSQRKERVFFWQKTHREVKAGDTTPYTPRYRKPAGVRTSRDPSSPSFPVFKDGETRCYTPDITQKERAGILNIADPTGPPLGGYHLKPAWRIAAVQYWAAKLLAYGIEEVNPEKVADFVKTFVVYAKDMDEGSQEPWFVVNLVARHFLEGTSPLGWPHFIRDVTATARSAWKPKREEEAIDG